MVLGVVLDRPPEVDNQLRGDIDIQARGFRAQWKSDKVKDNLDSDVSCLLKTLLQARRRKQNKIKTIKLHF